MNDEIKEVLDRLEGRKNCYLYHQKNNSAFNDEDYMAYMILDYITNLQQKEELLRQEISDVRKAFNGLQQEKDDLYLDNTMLKMENDIYKQGYEDLKDLLNILQNGSEKDA